MKVLLLAAGVGTRLRPLTDHLPKCLAPISRQPLLAYWLERFVAEGFDEIIVNTHHHAELVRRYLEASPWSRHLTILHEEVLLGTGGTLLGVRDRIAGGRVLMAHADNLTDFSPSALVATHETRPPEAAITMMTFRTDDPQSCGIVELDDRAVVTAFHEKTADPPGNLANAAVYVIEPEVFDFLDSRGSPRIDFSTEVLPHYLGRIFTYHWDGYHRDIGTLQSWAEAQLDFPAASRGAPDPVWNEILSLRPR